MFEMEMFFAFYTHLIISLVVPFLSSRSSERFLFRILFLFNWFTTRRSVDECVCSYKRKKGREGEGGYRKRGGRGWKEGERERELLSKSTTFHARIDDDQLNTKMENQLGSDDENFVASVDRVHGANGSPLCVHAHAYEIRRPDGHQLFMRYRLLMKKFLN